MAKIAKTTFTLTVLHPQGDNPAEHDIADIIREIDDGLWIGAIRHERTVDVRASQVREELLAVNNDGTFFDDYFDPADLAVGDLVGHRGKVGSIKNLRSFTEDGERFVFATVSFEDGAEIAMNVEELSWP